MKYFLGLAILGLCLASCAHSRVTMVGNERYLPIHEDEVTIILEFEDLPEFHEKVALINITYTTAFRNKMWANAKAKAAKLGCNGIYERYNQITDDSNSSSEIVAIRY